MTKEKKKQKKKARTGKQAWQLLTPGPKGTFICGVCRKPVKGEHSHEIEPNKVVIEFESKNPTGSRKVGKRHERRIISESPVCPLCWEQFEGTHRHTLRTKIIFKANVVQDNTRGKPRIRQQQLQLNNAR